MRYSVTVGGKVYTRNSKKALTYAVVMLRNRFYSAEAYLESPVVISWHTSLELATKDASAEKGRVGLTSSKAWASVSVIKV